MNPTDQPTIIDDLSLHLRDALKRHASVKSVAVEHYSGLACSIWAKTNDGEVMIVVGSSTNMQRAVRGQAYRELDRAIVEAVTSGCNDRTQIYARVREELAKAWNPLGRDPMRVLDARLTEAVRKGRIRHLRRGGGYTVTPN